MPRVRRISIRVPCSTSNIGPGFDVLGISLSLFLTVRATIPLPLSPSSDAIRITYEGDSPQTVPLDVERNLLTKVALFVAVANGQMLPPGMHVHIENPIPLGRGLGSSGAAVVAGALLADAACGLGLTRARLLDYCLAIEGHPDNVTASMMGGFCAGYLRQNIEDVVPDNLEQMVVAAWRGRNRKNSAQSANGAPAQDKSNHLAAVQPPLSSSPSSSSFLGPPSAPTDIPQLNPPADLGSYVRLPFNPTIRCIAVVPAFEVSTKLARKVLPQSYSRPDVVFNLQRLAILTHLLGQSPPNPTLITECMRDRIHQHYRQHLVPGLPQILLLHPDNIPGLLGVCQSGAGPTVLAFADSNYESVGEAVCSIWRAQKAPEKGAPEGIECRWMNLEVVTEPAKCSVEEVEDEVQP